MTQVEFDFTASSEGAGLTTWQEQQQRACRALAMKLGLPLDHPVEVWLKDGVRLRGMLQLREAPLFVEDDRRYELELEVDRVVFKHADLASCVVSG